MAVAARRSSDTLIIARTDARTGLGLNEAIDRGRLFAKAGADIIFVESPESLDEFKRIGCDTARSILKLSAEELERRTDLEIETITEVRKVLQDEFDREE